MTVHDTESFTVIYSDFNTILIEQRQFVKIDLSSRFIVIWLVIYGTMGMKNVLSGEILPLLYYDITTATMPVQNAFSERLGYTGFNFFLMLVVDLLHEFELGVWKSILIHLFCIVDSLKGSVPAELDCR